MGEESSGKWYTSPVVIAAVITGICGVLVAVISRNNTPVQPPTPPPTPVPRPSADVPKVEQVLTQPKPPPAAVEKYPAENNSNYVQIFQDDFEDGLTDWIVKRYDGYNNLMRWHISEREHFSGKSSLALGHEDTDKKDNNDTVYIETKKYFLLTEAAVLSFKLKKAYRINLEIVLRKKEAAAKETVIKFYSGNSTTHKEWREKEIPLEQYIDKGLYKIMLRAWDQGSLYLDDIEIQNQRGLL